MNTRGLPAVLLTLVACGGDANVEGNYTVALTNGTNGCAIASLEQGQQATGIPVTIQQDGTNVIAEVMGLSGIGLAALLGTGTFAGSVDGDDIKLTIVGTVNHSRGECVFTYNAELRGTLDGDTLAGEVLYRAATTDHPDCAPLAGCVTVQQYNGSRPP